jgi:hypothetical protein
VSTRARIGFSDPCSDSREGAFTLFVEVSTTAARLRRLLVGSRIRVGSISWRVAAVCLTESFELRIQLETPPRRVIAIQLPPLFDTDTTDHVAWLLHNIERLLGAG